MTDLRQTTSSDMLEQAERCIALADEADALIAMGNRAHALGELTRAAWIDQATDATLVQMFALERTLKSYDTLEVQSALARVAILVGSPP